MEPHQQLDDDEEPPSKRRRALVSDGPGLLFFQPDLLCHALYWLNALDHLSLGACCRATRNLLAQPQAWQAIHFAKGHPRPPLNLLLRLASVSTKHFSLRHLIKMEYQNLETLDFLSKSVHLRYLHMGRNNVRDAQALKNCPKLKKLFLNVVRPTTIDYLGCLPQLRILRLKASEAPGDLDYSSLSACVHLKSLTLIGEGNLDVAWIRHNQELTKLTLWGFAKIDRLGLLASLPDLKSVSLRCTGVTHVDALSDCENLCDVDLSFSAVRDISGLAKCVKLRELNLYRCPIADFAPVSACRELRFFRSRPAVGTVGPQDLHFLVPCTRLETLEVYRGTDITDLSPLTSMQNLCSVDLQGSVLITDLGVFRHCPKLRHLYLEGSRISDLNFLSHVPELQTLNFFRAPAGTEPLDLTPLANCSRLKKLWLGLFTNMGPVRSFSGAEAMGSLQNLVDLRLRHDTIQNLDFLTNCARLERLCLRAADLRDVTALRHCPFLEELELWICASLRNLGGVENKPKLRRLIARRCVSLEHVDALSSCASLERADFTSCHNLSHIRGLAFCRRLKRLDFSCCRNLTSLQPLTGCSHLRQVSLYTTGVQDVAPLLGCQRLQSLHLGVLRVQNLEHLRERLPNMRVF